MPRQPTRAEFDLLKAQHENLMAEVSRVREQLVAVGQELRVQFQRIAEIQAVLDEERMANAAPSEPRSSIRQRR
jgi:hypothetical protein